MSSILEHSAQFKKTESKIREAIVYGRLEEICPMKSTDKMSVEELTHDCNIAFKIIGYSPKNLDKVVRDIYLNEDIPQLFEFVYQVWLNDA